MARRKSDSPQKAAMRDMMSVLLEGALDEELNEELGYSRYDYRNKETDNSRNGHSRKTMHTSYGRPRSKSFHWKHYKKLLETLHIIREQMFARGGQEDSSVVYYERQE